MIRVHPILAPRRNLKRGLELLGAFPHVVCNREQPVASTGAAGWPNADQPNWHKSDRPHLTTTPKSKLLFFFFFFFLLLLLCFSCSSLCSSFAFPCFPRTAAAARFGFFFLAVQDLWSHFRRFLLRFKNRTCVDSASFCPCAAEMERDFLSLVWKDRRVSAKDEKGGDLADPSTSRPSPYRLFVSFVSLFFWALQRIIRWAFVHWRRLSLLSDCGQRA